MSRKSWINNMQTEEAVKINNVFHITKAIDQGKNKALANIRDAIAKLEEQRVRTAVRNYLRAQGLSERMVKVQFGRLAAGLAILPVDRLKVNVAMAPFSLSKDLSKN